MPTIPNRRQRISAVSGDSIAAWPIALQRPSHFIPRLCDSLNLKWIWSFAELPSFGMDGNAVAPDGSVVAFAWIRNHSIRAIEHRSNNILFFPSLPNYMESHGRLGDQSDSVASVFPGKLFFRANYSRKNGERKCKMTAGFTLDLRSIKKLIPINLFSNSNFPWAGE